MPDYEALLIDLAKHGKEVAKLEFSDSERNAVALKAKLREFKKKFDTFYEKVEGARVEIVSNKDGSED
jgi:hypothetical protein